jgi:hypothetical protein
MLERLTVQLPPLAVRPPSFTFCDTCGIDDSGFNLYAPRGPDDSSHRLLGDTRLTTGTEPVHRVLPASAVSITHVVHPHPMWTRGATSF